MKNKYVNIVAVLLFSLLLIAGVRNEIVDFEFEKITKTSKVPAVIQEVLAETELERGAYFFSSNFTDKDAYLIVCGGEEFKNSYDVDINSYKYHCVAVDGDKKTMYGTYELDITENSSTLPYEYSSESRFPFVVFKISGNAKQFFIEINSPQTLTINQWWGDGKKMVESKKWTSQVIYSKHEIPQFIDEDFKIRWGDIKEYHVYPNPNKKNANYIIIAGKEGEPPFDVSIEAIDWRREIVHRFTTTKQKTFNIIISKQNNAEFTFEQNGVPYSLIRVEYDNKLDALWPGSMIIVDEKLNVEKNK